MNTLAAAGQETADLECPRVVHEYDSESAAD